MTTSHNTSGLLLLSDDTLNELFSMWLPINCIRMLEAALSCNKGSHNLWKSVLANRNISINFGQVHKLCNIKYMEYLADRQQVLSTINFPLPSLYHCLTKPNIFGNLLRNVETLKFDSFYCDYPDRIPDAARSSLFTLFDSLTSVDFSDCHYYTRGTFIIHMAQQCPKLKAVNLSHCDSVPCEGVLILAQKCSLLERINLAFCPEVNDDCLVALSTHCPQLTDVNIAAYKSGITAAGYETFLTNTGHRLRTFCPSFTAATPALIEKLPELCHTICELDISMLTVKDTIKVFKIKQYHRTLTKLKFTSPRGQTYLEAIIKSLATMSSLTSLHLCADFFRSCDNVQLIISAGTLGVTLRHVRVYVENNEDIVAIATHCHKLRKLQLDTQCYISDETMRIVMDNCPHLEMFRAGKTREVEEETLLLLAEKCPNLQIVYCERDGERVKELNKTLDEKLSTLMFFNEFDPV